MAANDHSRIAVTQDTTHNYEALMSDLQNTETWFDRSKVEDAVKQAGFYPSWVSPEVMDRIDRNDPGEHVFEPAAKLGVYNICDPDTKVCFLEDPTK